MKMALDGRVLPALARGGGAAALTLLLAACSSAGGLDHAGNSGSGASTTGTGGSGTGGAMGHGASTGTGASTSTSASSGTGGSAGGTFASVCGFKTPVTLGSPGSDGFVEVPPAHPDILYFGRVDCADPTAPAFAYPGVSIRMRFQGDSLDLRLRDHGTGTATSTNYYDISFDGAAPVVLPVSPSQEIYPIGRMLGAGEHTVEVFKRIESGPGGTPDAGKGELLGFRVLAGSAVLPLAPRPHRIEFIGDSITCGYGVEVSITDPSNSHYTTQGSNADKAYGAEAARALNAEYVAVAYSGRGVYRNYAGGGGDTVPQMYGKTLPDEATSVWNTAAWTPDVVVINLGTNDFSSGGTDDAAFTTAYVAFLTTLRADYPAAVFILAAGPMISDYYPVGAMAWTRIQADLTQIVATRAAAGDSALHTLIIPSQSAPYGEDYHPTAATQQSMADAVVTLVKKLESW